MPLKYKIDVLDALKSAGFTTYKLRNEKLLSEGAVQNIRKRSPISWSNIEQLCRLLQCQPGDLMEYVEESSRRGE